MINLPTIEDLAFGRFGTFDVPCPICGPERRKPINRRRKVLRVWRLEPGFATYHCARCGESGHVRDNNSKPQINRVEFERRLAAARAEAAERERVSASERLEKALWLWNSRKPITEGVPPWKYLRVVRGYTGEIPATLGYLPACGEHGPAMIAAFGLAYESEPGLIEIADSQVRGVHITRLAPNGAKASTIKDKIMLGSSSGYPIVLAPPNDLLGLVITEGIEDALSIIQVKELGAWAAGSASRLPALADAIPTYVETITLFIDSDEVGRRNGEELAERLVAGGRSSHSNYQQKQTKGGSMTSPDDDPPGITRKAFVKPRDVNDILREEGPDAVRKVWDVAEVYKPKAKANSPHGSDKNKQQVKDGEKLRSKARSEEPPPATSEADYGFEAGSDQIGKDNKRDRFELEALDDIVIGDDPIELIPGILPMGPALGVGYGPPKSLKSFLLMHALLHVAGNIPYCGRDVQAGAIVYVTSEGVSGARRRLVGARRALGLEGKRVPFFLVPAMPNLGVGPQDREELRRKIAQKLEGLGVPLRAILLDTMRRAMPGKSENKPEDVSIVVDNCEALARAFNCLVMLIHHSPRSDDDRGSGSNALDAAADVMIGCKRDSATKIATATVRHLKDGEEGDTWQFELKPIEVGVDHDRNPIISRYVQITEEPERRAAPAPGKSLSAEQQRVFDILVGAVAEVGIIGLAGSAAPANTRAITRDTFTEFLKRNGWWDAANDSSARAKMSSRLNEIAGKHRIGLTDRYVWPVLFTTR
jgi:hypothetical protein